MASKFRPPPEYSYYRILRNYYRILRILEHENKTAALTLLPEDDPVTTRRSFHLSGEQDIQSIKEGLQKEGNEVYCVVVKVMWIEVLGNIQCLPKDPQIFKLPLEMLEKIWTYLGTEDLLSLRLVSSTFAYTFIPIHKVFHIWRMDFHDGAIYLTLRTIKENIDIHCHHPMPSISSVNQELLRTTKKVSMGTSFPQLFPKEWELLLNCCNRVEEFSLYGDNTDDDEEEGEDEQEDTDYTDVIRDISTQILLRNKDTLKKFGVHSSIPYTFDLSILSPCKELETIELRMNNNQNQNFVITNFESILLFKEKLRRIQFRGLADPLTKDQVLWIAENFKELETLEISVVHGCEQDIDQEVDGQVLLSILKKDCLPKLKSLWVFFACGGGCDKTDRIAGVVVQGQQGETRDPNEWISMYTGIRFDMREDDE